jgi:glycosyltransferase involved in cell wall biosynthesis
MTGYGLAGAVSGIVPLITMALGSDVLLDTKGFGLKRILCNYVARRSSKIITVSEHIRKTLLSWSVEPSKIAVCPIGIDLNLFEWPHDSNVREQGLIVSTRPFEPIYNVEQLIRALPIVFKKNKYAKAELIGEGSLKSRYEKLCLDLGIDDRVKFKGVVSLSELIKTLQRAEIYVSVSKSDGAPVSLFEAMACGCFPILSDIEANRAWIKDGINGYLIPLYNPNMLAERVLRSFNEKELFDNARTVNRKAALENADTNRVINLLEHNFSSRPL